MFQHYFDEKNKNFETVRPVNVFRILDNEQKLSNRNNCNKINLFNKIYIF